MILTRQIVANKRSSFDQIDDRSDMTELKRSFDAIDDVTDLEEGKRGSAGDDVKPPSSSRAVLLPGGGHSFHPVLVGMLEQLKPRLPVYDDDVIDKTTSKMADLNNELRRLASIVCDASIGQRVTSLNRKRNTFQYGPKTEELLRKRSFDPIGEASDLSEVK